MFFWSIGGQPSVLFEIFENFFSFFFLLKAFDLTKEKPNGLLVTAFHSKRRILTKLSHCTGFRRLLQVGTGIPSRALGFPTLEAFLATIPDTCAVQWRGGQLNIVGVASSATAAVAALISKQSNKKSGGGGRRMGGGGGGGGGRSYGGGVGGGRSGTFRNRGGAQLVLKWAPGAPISQG